jgi:hypothetical protein
MAGAHGFCLRPWNAPPFVAVVNSTKGKQEENVPMASTNFTCPSCGTVLSFANEEALARMTHCSYCQAPTGQSGPAVTTPPQSRADSDSLDEEPVSGGLATMALWLGLLSLVASVCATFFLDFLPSMFVVGAVTLPTVIVCILALVELGGSKGAWKGRGKAALGLAAAGLAVAVAYLIQCVVVPGIRTAAEKTHSRNNLKQIGLAMWDYHDANGFLPPAGVAQGGGPNFPHHSWRVYLLPYLREKKGMELYNQYNFTEPWDSPNNKKLLFDMPHCYAAPGKDSAKGLTYYQAFVGPRTAFEPNGLHNIAELKGSQTILIVEAAQPVEWTKPDDIPYDPGQPVPQLGGLFPNGSNVLYADGTVEWMPWPQDPELLRARIHR